MGRARVALELFWANVAQEMIDCFEGGGQCKTHIPSPRTSALMKESDIHFGQETYVLISSSSS
jgi:hypothetical protein